MYNLINKDIQAEESSSIVLNVPDVIDFNKLMEWVTNSFGFTSNPKSFCKMAGNNKFELKAIKVTDNKLL